MKIISFSSHTAIWYFAFAEAVVAHELQNKGHEVLFITPGKLFKGKSNLRQEQILRKQFSLKGYELKDILSSNDIKKIKSILNKLNKNNFEKLKIDGVNIGKYSIYEYLLNRKKMKAELSEKEWKKCLIDVKNTLISFFACRKIIKRENPDRILMYGELYSVNRVWERYSYIKGIPVYFLHHGLNFSDIDNTLIIARTTSIDFFSRLISVWLKLKNIPVSKKRLSYVTDNFFELLNAKNFLVYSAPKSNNRVNIREIFGISNSQKILTATMSSYDEMFAAKYVGAWNLSNKPIFVSQIEWIKALSKYVKKRNDLFLIIRVHPREFPNKRDSVKSEHAKILKQVFEKLPKNVKINWPTDNISLYDLAKETNVFLNAWSTVGVEMSLLGIPVVLFSKDFVLYPPTLNYVAKNKNDYFRKIEYALKKGWSYEKIKMTYRWLALFYCHTIIRFRHKEIKHDKSIINKFVINLNYIFYKLLSPEIKTFLVRIYHVISSFGISKRQEDECKKQLTEKINISSIEKMLIKSGDTLVDSNRILKDKVTTETENNYMCNEVKRLYKALYNLDEENNIKKDSLQYNLKNVFK